MKYKKKTRIWLYLEILLFIVVVFVLAIEIYFYFNIKDILYPQKKSLNIDLKSLLIESINVEITNEDGQKLVGWLLLNRESKNKAMLMLPGYEADKAELINVASKIFDSGYSVLLIDLRAQGDSEGDRSTLGIKEKDDVIYALTYLINDNRVKATSVGIWADNVSAYASILAVEKFPQVKLLLLNNIYPNPIHYIKNKMKLSFVSIESIIDYIINQNLKFLIGKDFIINDLKDTIPNLKGRNLIFFQTDKAEYSYVKNLYDIAPERKELIVLKQVGIDALNSPNWEEYYKLIEEKISTYLPLDEIHHVVSLYGE